MDAKQITISDLINEIEKRVDDKILERENADLIIKLINKADSLTEAITIAQLGTTYRRTGLHYDKRIEKFGDTIKYFRKNESLSFSDGSDKPHHKLIIGDNYEALLNLLIEYNGKIDVIYIDPPYGKDSMGEFLCQLATNNNPRQISAEHEYIISFGKNKGTKNVPIGDCLWVGFLGGSP